MAPYSLAHVGTRVKSYMRFNQTPAEAGGQLEIAQEEHGNQRGPDLGLYGIGRGPEKGLDLQVLFQGFQEQCNLPAILVPGGNRARPQAVIIREEHQDVAGIFPNGFNATEPVRALLLGPSTGQSDGLIFENAPMLRGLPLLHHFKLRIGLYARDEGHPGLCRGRSLSYLCPRKSRLLLRILFPVSILQR